MPFDYITESATVDTLATFLETEIGNILESEQVNAAVYTRLTQLLDIAAAVNAFNS